MLLLIAGPAFFMCCFTGRVHTWQTKVAAYAKASKAECLRLQYKAAYLSKMCASGRYDRVLSPGPIWKLPDSKKAVRLVTVATMAECFSNTPLGSPEQGVRVVVVVGGGAAHAD